MYKKSIIIGLCLVGYSILMSEPKDAPSLFDRKKKREDLVPFSFTKKPLVDIIEELSAKKGVNVILPQQAAELEAIKKQMVTFHPQAQKEIPLQEAWTALSTFLELSGFALSKKNDTLYSVVRIGRPDEAGIVREILPLHVNTPPSDLPPTDERIRYIYYLKNLKVPGQEDRDTNPIARIFKDMLSPGTPVVYEPKSNSIIITDRSDIISSAMKIISELDNSGFKETIEVIQLHNIPARDVVKVFDSLKKAAGEPGGSPYIRGGAQTESIGYFASDTKIIADDLHNSLILMGRQSAVERISDFVQDFMDVTPEKGASILHSYDLQYLNAKEFAEVLTRVVAPLMQAGPQAAAGPAGGPERYFQGVVVYAEEVKAVEIKTTTEEITLEAKGGYTPIGLGAQQIITGGNRLIVAALQDDWIKLRDLIETLDKPQPQVILEVLVIDVLGTKQHIVAGDIRNLTRECSDNGVQFLSSNITPVTDAIGAVPPALAVDLLGVLTNNVNPSIASLLAPGSLIVSFNDPKTPGIFGLLQVLDQTINSKVVSHPYLITTNNQKATIASQTLIRTQGDAVPGAAGVITIEIVDVSATLQLQMIPRLSSLDRLSLQIAVDINEFTNPTTLTRLTRRVNTNANIGSGQILVIGGLTQISQTDIKTGTPLLQSIPLIGSFFSGKNKTTAKSNLAIFISPTIIQPKLRGGLNVFTADKIRKSRRDIEDIVVFNDQRDPITRLFFRTPGGSDRLLQDYLTEVTNPPDAEAIKTAKEKRMQHPRTVRKPRTAPHKGIVHELPA